MKSLLSLLLILVSFNICNAQWEFIKGNDYDSRYPRYTSLDQQDAYNTPGGQRSGSATWIYNNELYLFGGSTTNPTLGYGSVSYNDIWKFNKATGLWTWIKGSNQPDDTATLGSIGIEATANLPGSCSGFAYWVIGHKLYIDNGKMWVYNMGTNNWVCLKDPSNDSVNYGQKGIEDSLNNPSSRIGSVCWTINGDLYLFGGYKSSSDGFYNDLWSYDTATNNWVWIKGPDYPNGTGSVGQVGVADSANNPPFRMDAYRWVINDKLYLYGGNQSIYGNLSDLWEYDYTTNNWTCLNGSMYAVPDYGIQNTFAAANTPGSRAGGQSWVYDGNLYLFGGVSAGALGDLYNDIWEYSPSLNQWKWVKGSNYPNQNGTYNYLNIILPGNQIGARTGSLLWNENDSIYIANGDGFCFNGAQGGLADMWKYNKATNDWVWISGINNASLTDVSYHDGQEDINNKPGQGKAQATWKSGDNTYIYTHPGGSVGPDLTYGPLPTIDELWRYDNATNNWALLEVSASDSGRPVYGTLNTFDSANTPGYRTESAYWFYDNKLYLFGGIVYYYTGAVFEDSLSNSLWEYDLNTNQWKWIKGNQSYDQAGIYGIQGAAAAANAPGARTGAQFFEWNDKFYLFGGHGFDHNGSEGDLNDMWEYDPQTNNWTWIKGSNTIDEYSDMGTQGVFNSANHPGGRENGVSWIYNNSFYVFSGRGVHPPFAGAEYYLPELWEYDLSSNNWRFLKGYTGAFPDDYYAHYGTKGTADSINRPGQRIYAATAVVGTKLYLFGGYGTGGDMGQGGGRSDLWSYDPATNNWTWIAGSANAEMSTVFPDTPGVASEQVGPGFRTEATGWEWDNHFYISGGETWVQAHNNEVWRFDLCDSTAQCYSAPIVNLGNDTTLCAGNYIELNAGNYGDRFLWSTGDTTQSIVVTQSDTFWVKVTNPNNLMATDTIQVTLVPAPQAPFLPGTQNICEGDSFLLDAQNPGCTYLWNTGATTQTVQPDSSGTYSVWITNTNGCGIIDSMQLFAASKPAVDLGSDTGLCAAYQGIQFYISAPYDVDYTYLWNTSDTLYGIFVDSAGNYSVKVTNQYGCVSRDTIHVSFDTLLNDFSLGNDTAICPGIPLLLNAYHPGYSYYWQNSGDTTASISVNQAGTYLVSLFSPYGCQNDASINVGMAPLPSASDIVDLINGLVVDFSILNPQNVTSVLWSFGDGTTDTSQSPVHTFTSGGSYSVGLILTNGCGSDTLHKTIVLQQPPNGIEHTAKDDNIQVFPNPAKQYIFIQSGEKNINRISLTDVLGQKLVDLVYLNKKNIIVDLSALSPGIYTLKIEAPKMISYRKIEILK